MAAAMSVVPGAAGSNSKAFQATAQADAVGTIDNATLLTGVTAGGQLANFLNTTTFANDAAAETAWRAIGGEVTVRQTGGTAASTSVLLINWKAAGGAAKPTFQITAVGVTDGVFEVVLAARHSIPL